MTYLFANPINVGAGLPAMQATRCICQTEAMPSQASQLPHLTEFDSRMWDNARHFEPNSRIDAAHDRPQHTQSTAQEA
jgi:hypothetical protein